MDKRYQVFVSSTYADLKDERQKVIQTLMEMDCIPSGMELFPALDEEQFEFIKKVIDDCDYYLLVIGARYGSVTEEGVSYTEKEYDYAVERGIKVVAFVHADPDAVPVNKTDKSPVHAERLQKFRDKVATGRLVKFWSTSNELAGLVALSLSKTIKTYPAVGWTRADKAGTPELFAEVHALQAENKALRERAEKAEAAVAAIANWNETYNLEGVVKKGMTVLNVWRSEVSWAAIFVLIGPPLEENVPDYTIRAMLCKFCEDSKRFTLGVNAELSEAIFKEVKIQMLSFGVVAIRSIRDSDDVSGIYWKLTDAGRAKLGQFGAVLNAPSQIV